MASYLRHFLTPRHLFRYSYRVAVGLAGISFLHNSVLEVTGVQGHSMSPTLSPEYYETGRKDLVLFNRLTPTHELRRGDIVSFWAPHAPERISVKRVVALEGDTVITKGRGNRPQYLFPRLVVPHNHVWVEGDNWRNSRDSNDFGPLSKGLINGRAVCVVSPWSRYNAIAEAHGFKPRSTVVPCKGPSMIPPEFVD
ncbi:LexA/Signal peptidase [Saccharata proteae CBS 121410]|uniref:Mitochondrial inner membrane protease subunit n=1 Tax=Saccharata proteae CBS 121410 TaxID=1314787 RepID=A0A6A5YEL6_9PEZI|nr:LexA/Signal peptidase [Saccharata proteae CBS 121410]